VVDSISPNYGTTLQTVTITVDNSVGATGATIGGLALGTFRIVDGTHVSGTVPSGLTPDVYLTSDYDVAVTNSHGPGTPLSKGFRASTEPVDPGTGYLFSDNFDSYSTWADVNSAKRVAYYVAGQSNPTLITGRSGSGKAMRVSFPVEGGSGDWNPPGGHFESGAFTQSNPWATYSGAIVVQNWFRVSTTALDFGDAAKWMYFINGSANRINEIPIISHNGISPIPEYGRHVFYVEGTGTLLYPMGDQPVGPYFAHNRSGQPASVNDGSWHRETILLRPQSSAGANNGRLARWVDGIKTNDVSSATEDLTPSGSDGFPWCYSSNPHSGLSPNPRDISNVPVDLVRGILFPANIPDGQAITQAFTKDWDDVKVWSVP